MLLHLSCCPQQWPAPCSHQLGLCTHVLIAVQKHHSMQAALLSNGLYMACTPGWRQLSPRESCLLQIIATHHQPEEDHFTMAVYLDDGASQPYELMASRIREGVQLVCICQHAPNPEALGSSIYSSLKPVESIYRVSPYSRRPPNQQLASLPFNLALIVTHQTPKVILVPGNQQLGGPQYKAGEAGAGSHHPGMLETSSSPQSHGNRGTRDDKGLQDRGIRSTRLKAEEDGQPIALTQQTELMAFMLRCNLKGAGGCAATSEQTPQAAPAAGAHGSLKGACGKAGGQGEIEEESQGAAERGPGPSARNGLGAEKGIVVDYQEDVACEGGTCLAAVVCSRPPHKATVYVSRSLQSGLLDAINMAKTLFDLTLSGAH
mmetsp:Transcript_1948/g.4925  ORF Transcript_1948/g.4925 Transcript_1948/m.4925 type:complete len:375 (-) Transcript_1948:596-1720(-)